MSRAVRIERAGGRYDVTARGNERREIFREDTGHLHFLELLSEYCRGRCGLPVRP
jgi:hypothetical protein